ncbi:MAG: nickel/cobalt transporter [Paracoccaceae bacterium]
MRRPVLISGLLVIAVLAGLWLSGGFAWLSDWALGQQRAVQNSMASGIRAVRAGDTGAVAALLAVCFTYGFVHAAGPGHGKLLIGGYGVGRRVGLWRLVAIAFASSMAQAAVAVLLVAGVFVAFGWTRERVLGLSDDVMAPVGHVLVALVGMWLVWRGVQGLRRSVPAARAPQHGHDHGHGHHHDHDHDHDHDHNHEHGHDHPHDDAHCETCGHAHAPSMDQVQALSGWRDTAALIAGIAIRPCSGALFLLILTWQMGIIGAGVAGTFVMGLGTASVTMTVALLAVWSREGALASLSGSGLARALPVIELCAGAVVTLVALQMLRMAL